MAINRETEGLGVIGDGAAPKSNSLANNTPEPTPQVTQHLFENSSQGEQPVAVIESLKPPPINSAEPPDEVVKLDGVLLLAPASKSAEASNSPQQNEASSAESGKPTKEATGITNIPIYDERALGELYDRYSARIYSYIYRRTGDKQLAHDLHSKVFLKMLEAIRSDKAWHSSFSGWLYRIAHNAVIDYYRERDRTQQVSLEDTLTTTASDHNPVVMAEARLDAERLRVAISRLTEEQAEVITLRFLEGYSISEVAEMLDKTEGSIKALQYRAVTTLRQLLQHEGFN